MGLEKYNEKRNFENTSEPIGKTKKTKNKKPIFVVQYHKARAKHYDFRIEHNGVLISFAIPKGLPQSPKTKRLAVHVEDHPLDYANFEGVIPKGNYGAGVVEIFDKGYFIPEEDIEKGLKKGHIKFTLNGNNLKGEWSLIKTDDKNWIIIKANDKFAKKVEPKTKKEKNPFKDCKVKPSLLSNTIPKGKNWIFEIKYDGYRIISYIENGKPKLVSRNGNLYTTKFSKIAESLCKMAKDIPMVLDGEVVSFDTNGRSDFGLLQNNIKQNSGNFIYVVFDILALNGKDLRDTPLKERKNILEKVMINCPNNLLLSSYVIGKGKESFQFAKKMNLEGIVAKDLNSTYNGIRDESWLKIKCYKRQEFVVGGYTTSEKNKTLSAILVGYYNNNDLIYVGKVGTGFSEETKKDLSKTFKKLIQNNSSFKNLKESTNNTTWLKPEIIAEVQFAEFTKEHILRQPSFIGIRTDKNPKDVKLEKVYDNT